MNHRVHVINQLRLETFSARTSIIGAAPASRLSGAGVLALVKLFGGPCDWPMCLSVVRHT